MHTHNLVSYINVPPLHVVALHLVLICLLTCLWFVKYSTGSHIFVVLCLIFSRVSHLGFVFVHNLFNPMLSPIMADTFKAEDSDIHIGVT